MFEIEFLTKSRETINESYNISNEINTMLTKIMITSNRLYFKKIDNQTINIMNKIMDLINICKTVCRIIIFLDLIFKVLKNLKIDCFAPLVTIVERIC